MTEKTFTDATEKPAVGFPVQQPVRPLVWARKDQIQHASTRGGLMCAMYPNTDRRADLQPLYDQAALDAAVAEANRRQNAAWALMAGKLAAAERERCALKAAIHSQYPVTTEYDKGYAKARADAAAAIRGA